MSHLSKTSSSVQWTYSRATRSALRNISTFTANTRNCSMENRIRMSPAFLLNIIPSMPLFKSVVISVFGRACLLFTFCVSRRRRKMYCGHARLCVCVCVCLSVCLSTAVCPHYCTDPDVTWGRGRGCPLVVHCWADLQSVHRLHCYGNITRTLVYAGCARVAD